MIDIDVLFGTVIGFVVTMPLVIEFIKRLWNSHFDDPKPDVFPENLKIEGWSARIISWLLCILFALIGFWFNIGVFKEFNTFQTIFVGLFAALTSNGLYNTRVVTYIANSIERLWRK